jgi:Malectin domain
MRRLLLLAISALTVSAQEPVVSPSSPTVAAGKTLQFTANRSVTWSLAPGSAGSINGTGLYTAPASVAVKQKAGGCQVYPASSIFNTRVDALPLNSNSATWIGLFGQSRMAAGGDFGLNIATNSTPLFGVVNYYTTDNNGQYPLLPFPQLKMQGGYLTTYSGLDRHVTTVNRETCEFTEIYSPYPAGTIAAYGCPLCTAQSAWRYSGNAFALSTTGTTDAAGLPLQPMLLRLQDILQGEIKHMMRFTATNNIIGPTFSWPATGNAGAYGSIPYGSIFRLKSSYDISSFSATAQLILTAWKRYGIILADGGGTGFVSTDWDITLNPNMAVVLKEIENSNVAIQNFEIVDPSSMMVSASSAAVKYNNAYQVPDGFAVAIAEDTTSHLQTKVYIALQGITVGVPNSGMVFQAGGPAVQLTSWVNGSANQSVTWAISPSVGTLTSGGLYTPPASVSVPTFTTFTATAAADSSATVKIYATIWPAGIIRVNVGNSSSDIVDSGNTWFKDMAWEGPAGAAIFDNTSYTSPVPAYYYTSRYTIGDMLYKLNLANGNYKVNVYRGQTYAGNTNPIPSNNFLTTWDSQGQYVATRYDQGLAQGYYGIPAPVLSFPMQVTDGTANFNARAIADDPSAPGSPTCVFGGTGACPPYMNAFSIEADATPAHIAIDGTTTDLTIGQTRQLYAVGWYMANTATWAVTSGPGSIDSNGLYTAPSTPPGASTAVTITATSTVDGSKTATITFNFVFATIVVSPSTPTIAHGQTRTYSAAIGGVSYTNVAWSRSPDVGSIDVSTGLYTAPITLASNTAVTITATSLDDGSKTGTVTVTVLKLAPPLYLNLGGPAFTGDGGIAWLGDEGTVSSYCGTSSYYTDRTHTILGTTAAMQPLYQSSRYLGTTGANMDCSFTAPPGTYTVTLKFSDNGFTEAGHLVQNVIINGVTVLSNFDMHVAAGANYTAVDRTFTVVNSGSSIAVGFHAAVGNYPGVNGIQIVEIPVGPDGTNVSGAVTLGGKVVIQ